MRGAALTQNARARAQVWDGAEVHGAALVALRSGLEVPNFAIRAPTKAEALRTEVLRNVERKK